MTAKLIAIDMHHPLASLLRACPYLPPAFSCYARATEEVRVARFEAWLSEAITYAGRSGKFQVSNHQLRELPHELRDRAPKLKSIDIDDSGLENLPDWLGECHNLTEVNISGSALLEIPPVLARVTKLERLGVAGSQITAIPEWLSRMPRLRTLSVAGSGITHLPANIGESQLEHLDIAANPLKSLDGVQLPITLESLSIWGLGLTSLPTEMRHLTALKLLIAGNVDGRSGLSSYPDIDNRPRNDFEGVRSASKPSAFGQSIHAIPEWIAEFCRNLVWIDLRGNLVERIPSGLIHLRRLQVLLLQSNRIERIPDGILTMDQLRIVDLAGNAIRSLPDRPAAGIQPKYIDVRQNLLEIPPEVLKSPENPVALWRYWADLGGGRKPLDEAKLLVVGEGAVGKTSLVRRLVGSGFDADQRKTEGIDVQRWAAAAAGTDISVNIWDFGGQEIMHATHQFFLTSRSVYVLVLDARKSKDQNRLEYWLKLIQGFSGGSPVIVVGNKCENIPLDLDRRGLKIKYPNIVTFIETSCVSDLGINMVRSQIEETISTLDHIRDLLPSAFFRVKAELENIDADYLPYSTFVECCERHGVSEESVQFQLIDLLHDLGTILCFRRDDWLSDTSILNPGWVTGGVYKLINSSFAHQRRGLLSYEDIHVCLGSSEYPHEKHHFIVEMMRKFNLCFESDGTYFVPDLLVQEEPDTGSWDDAFKFVVHYDVMPSSIIGRLIVRTNVFINKGTVWRTGVVLQMDGNRALIRADSDDRLLTILISGPPKGRRSLLAVIRGQLRWIERTIPGLQSEERLSVPGYPDVWVPYSQLLLLEQAGERTVIPIGMAKPVEIASLLDGIETKEERHEGGDLAVDEPLRAPKAPRHRIEAPAAPWMPNDSMRLGWLLLLATLAVLITSGLLLFWLSGLAVTIAGGFTLCSVVVVGLILLRSSGRLSESGFLKSLRNVLSRYPKSGAGTADGGN